jgi:hypothetical protein
MAPAVDTAAAPALDRVRRVFSRPSGGATRPVAARFGCQRLLYPGGHGGLRVKPEAIWDSYQFYADGEIRSGRYDERNRRRTPSRFFRS